MTDLELLETIDAYYPHPYRLRYMRCWGCGKRRLFGNWWEGYQTRAAVGPKEDPHWGYFCAECIVIVASLCTEAVRRETEEIRLITLEEVLDLFDCELSDSAAHFYDKIEALWLAGSNEEDTP